MSDLKQRQEANAAPQVLLDLIASRQVIADERNWCRKALHYKERHCALGAILVGVGVKRWWGCSAREHAVAVALGRCIPDYPGHDHRADGEVVYFNNNHTHAEVLDLFDRAIAVQMGEIGEPVRRRILVPDDLPAEAPMAPPAPPAQPPQTEPAHAPAEPEKVPA